MKKIKSKLQTERESLASINQSLREISQSLRGISDLLLDNRGDGALASITEALFDIGEYGPGKVPKGRRDGTEGDTQKEG